MLKDFAGGGLVSSCTDATSPTTSPTTTLTTTTTATSTGTTTPTTTFVEAALYCETFYGKEFLAVRKGVSCANHVNALTGAFDDCPGETPQLACSELLKDGGTVMVLRAVSYPCVLSLRHLALNLCLYCVLFGCLWYCSACGMNSRISSVLRIIDYDVT